ncbi:hypothetical protein OO015_01480 [Thermomicrobium sp. 4228-Ro]|uniref:hypothetical protein n=1 Tax=Thermomicrobium sp. 4228-Ro TaxID=2993937 RepID=UPI00224903F4|nr:hypothetical protein [Thermomicrobium sp. 4228-Ro]MCX2726173.1 hypothetical protein [Thermomicrobium sp. 4228-Ro]
MEARIRDVWTKRWLQHASKLSGSSEVKRRADRGSPVGHALRLDPAMKTGGLAVWWPTGEAKQDQPTVAFRRSSAGRLAEETADLATYLPRNQALPDQRRLLRRIVAPIGRPEYRVRARGERGDRQGLLPRTKPSVSRQRWNAVRWSAFGIGILLAIMLGAIGAALAIPRATVTITPAIEERRLSLVYSPLSTEGVDWVAPTRTVRAVVEATVEGVATGTKQVPDGVARGRIRIVNATLDPFSIVAGREIRANNGIVYRVTETVYVPAADPFGSQSFGVADAPVEATMVGPEGNAEPGVVSGQLADGVLFRNIEPISGGTTRPVHFVTSDDLARLRAEVEHALQERVASVLTDTLAESETIVEGTVRTSTPVVDFSHEINTETDRITAHGRMVVEAVAYDAAAMHRQAQEEAARRLAQSTEMDVVILGNTLTFGEPQQVAPYRWRVDVSAQVRVVPIERELQELREKIAGESVARAVTEARKVAGVAGVVIDIQPHWWPDRLPDRVSRIEVVVRERGE